MRKVYVISNPLAGSGNASRAMRGVLSALRNAHIPTTTLSPTQSSDATRVAYEIGCSEQQSAAIIAVGGDGTLNDIASGLVRSSASISDVPIGIIPAGTGNDFARIFRKDELTPFSLVRRLVANQSREMDVGLVNDRIFINSFGWGFEGHVAEESRNLSRALGPAKYPLGVIRALRAYKTASAQFIIDDTRLHFPVSALSVANGPSVGGGFRLCPYANPIDGLLDIFLAEALSPVRAIAATYRVIRGNHSTDANVYTTRARQIQVVASVPLPGHVDGNLLSTPVSQLFIQVLPRRLRILN